MSNSMYPKSTLKSYLFKTALEILTDRITNFDNFLYWEEFGFKNRWDGKSKEPSLDEMKVAAENLIYHQFDELCDRLFDLESKTSEDRDY